MAGFVVDDIPTANSRSGIEADNEAMFQTQKPPSCDFSGPGPGPGPGPGFDPPRPYGAPRAPPASPSGQTCEESTFWPWPAARPTALPTLHPAPKQLHPNPDYDSHLTVRLASVSFLSVPTSTSRASLSARIA